jgi:hypothetical protein
VFGCILRGNHDHDHDHDHGHDHDHDHEHDHGGGGTTSEEFRRVASSSTCPSSSPTRST